MILLVFPGKCYNDIHFYSKFIKIASFLTLNNLHNHKRNNQNNSAKLFVAMDTKCSKYLILFAVHTG
jgi:hypothetical protein